MNQTFRVGTRGSELALAQARLVIRALSEANAGVTFESVTVRTRGDRQEDGQALAFGVGLFVREIERALLEGDVDLAVHSLKDVPTAIASGTVIAAVPERADPRDAFVSRDGTALDRLSPGSKVGTSSARRRAQLMRARPDLEVVGLRGNLDTRLRKLDSGHDGLSGIVVAAAGLSRTGRIERAADFLHPARFLPAAGQGAVAVQARAMGAKARDAAAKIDHAETRLACNAEREFVSVLDSGCRAPVGVLAEATGRMLRLRGAVYSTDGVEEIDGRVSGRSSQWKALAGRLADDLASRGAIDLIAAARESSA